MASNTTPLWLFDLDNTLHNASHAIFPAINTNMNRIIKRVLDSDGQPSDEAAVNYLRRHYWKLYGATLLGLVRHHGLGVDEFLHEAHLFDDLPGMVRAERGIGRWLSQLPGQKILLTNAPRRYSRELVRHLGLHRHFSHHISIESMHVHRQLRPKPSRIMLRKLLARHKVAPRRCILVEDTVDNLKSARELGVRTAWVTQYLRGSQALLGHMGGQRALSRLPGFVDVKVRSVRQLPRRLAALGAAR
ncbi:MULTISPECIES: HAD-IA family hydrolase [unclassified Herbaspirillum]|uniref:HAD-IA family hydrolase n=1 Tax=Herbaspirillum TaxID=963 RepID=UPI000C0A7094|nr:MULTISPECIES: HAD-IA family hydrolase [unclassified Herbaspirillum]MAF05141.1 phosphoglycolate phosphatase [Herbaspirillum sp.]MBO14830.1 phosphoglycolate phosphatase [Herbaspirillum sp.]